MMRTIAPIVEGHGDSLAIRPLVDRVLAEFCPGAALNMTRPLRIPKGKLLKADELERVLRLAAGRLRTAEGGILILVDSDDDCPRDAGPALLDRARRALPTHRVEVVLAEREFEAWGLAAARSLRGWRGLPDDLDPPADPQGVQGAKEWLTARMGGAGAYSPTADQASLAATMDLREARAASSFDKFCRAACALAAGSAS